MLQQQLISSCPFQPVSWGSAGRHCEISTSFLALTWDHLHRVPSPNPFGKMHTGSFHGEPIPYLLSAKFELPLKFHTTNFFSHFVS